MTCVLILCGVSTTAAKSGGTAAASTRSSSPAPIATTCNNHGVWVSHVLSSYWVSSGLSYCLSSATTSVDVLRLSTGSSHPTGFWRRTTSWFRRLLETGSIVPQLQGLSACACVRMCEVSYVLIIGDYATPKWSLHWWFQRIDRRDSFDNNHSSHTSGCAL